LLTCTSAANQWRITFSVSTPLFLPLEKDAAKGAMNDLISCARSRKPTRGKNNGATTTISFLSYNGAISNE
jgi:hypothetical protein